MFVCYCCCFACTLSPSIACYFCILYIIRLMYASCCCCCCCCMCNCEFFSVATALCHRLCRPRRPTQSWLQCVCSYFCCCFFLLHSFWLFICLFCCFVCSSRSKYSIDSICGLCVAVAAACAAVAVVFVLHFPFCCLFLIAVAFAVIVACPFFLLTNALDFYYLSLLARVVWIMATWFLARSLLCIWCFEYAIVCPFN